MLQGRLLSFTKIQRCLSTISKKGWGNTQKDSFMKNSLSSFESSSPLFNTKLQLSHRRINIAASSSVGTRDTTDKDSFFGKIGLLLGVATCFSLNQMLDNNSEKTRCCGIAGVVGQEGDDARQFLLEGLTVLKNRGYDSAGMATISNDGKKEIVCTKYASNGEKADSIELVRDRSLASRGHHVGIAHTRWATHGGKTDFNAHPHMDSTGKIALVHNGTINNANELRKELREAGHIFTSQTDTEVVAKLIGHIKMKNNVGIREATEMALKRCDGTWGICVMCKDEPDTLVVACNGSPLVIGISDGRTYVASETSAFNRYTKNFISMKDGEIGVLSADGGSLDLERMQTAPNQEIILSPDPYPHWTLKECLEQPEAIARALSYGGRLSPDTVMLGGLDDNSEYISKIKYMLLSACGTSLHAAKYAEKIMKNLGTFDWVVASDAAETDAKDFPLVKNGRDAGLIVVSQSGETKDAHRVVKSAIKEDVLVMSVVNAVGSLIARTTRLGVYCNAGRENAVASTKAFTSQVTVLALIALWFRQAKDKINGGPTFTKETNELKESLMRLPIVFGMGLKAREQCKEIAKSIAHKEHCFVLGKGYGEPVALEGALKIKEMCYMHAEGYSGGALKHGPFALIEDKNGKNGATPIILIILDDNHASHMRTAAEEVKARGAQLIVITDKASLADGLDDNPILIGQNGPLTALGAVLPLQLLAYELALLRNINPDTPRNLAKAVTVD